MSKNPSVTEMCLLAVRAAAHQKSEHYAESQNGDEMIVLALRVLIESIEKELKK